MRLSPPPAEKSPPASGGPARLWLAAGLCLAAVVLTGLTAGPARAQAQKASRRAAPYKVAVFAPLLPRYEPNAPYAAALQRILARQSWGKRVEQHFYPPNALSEPAVVSQALESLADDPEVKAVILGGSPQGSLEGCARLRTRRPDILIIALDPEEDPQLMNRVASLTLTLNHAARGFLIPTLAQRMEASALVYFSFPRHQRLGFFLRQRRIMTEVARDLGLVVITAPNCPDPLTTEKAELEAYVATVLERYRERFGRKLALYATDDALSEILIHYALKNGDLALDPVHPALFLGLPEALGLVKPTRDLFGQWRRLLTLEDERYMSLGLEGQVSTWAGPYTQTAILAIHDTAVTAIQKQTDFYDPNYLTAALEKYSPGDKWAVSVVRDYDNDVIVPQLVVVMADSYWFGHGYQGFTRLNIPTKYYRLK
ncbi:lipoprotein [Deltaproteobacteria bacterium]|nr:lipoprotein [Deltaproteobacteria bacterium]